MLFIENQIMYKAFDITMITKNNENIHNLCNIL